MSGPMQSASCTPPDPACPLPVLGRLGQGGVLLLDAARGPRGTWTYTYSVRPGRQVMIVTEGGPDRVAPDDPIYLEVINGLASYARPAP
jgi:hypothetical protein